MGFLGTVLSTPARLAGIGRNGAYRIAVSKRLVASAQNEISRVLEQLNSTQSGLSQADAEARLEEYGPNEIAKEKRQTFLPSS